MKKYEYMLKNDHLTIRIPEDLKNDLEKIVELEDYQTITNLIIHVLGEYANKTLPDLN